MTHYSAAVEDLKRIYIARDYPVKLVKSWIKNHASERWEKKYGTKDDGLTLSPLILKTELNAAWDSQNDPFKKENEESRGLTPYLQCFTHETPVVL
ncbi:putative reverse [Trichoderma cornu-damae]|uniref:Reverse n=1 Tax=Trichoderma cornu-damae TaxID=654480 RepID=A0A9P8TTJ0_9HYPO|nr:putative reverse [Trichoderma cornu-damae]